MEKVRVRFAPSPTGELHIGGARTALFNWLFARNRGGSLVLRVDDTDRQRSSRQYLDSIIESMRWLGLDWDEGPLVGGPFAPYVQSERLPIYRQEAEKLLQKGMAYPCFCTAEALAEQKEKFRRMGQPPRYTGSCRNLSEMERELQKAEGRSYVLRLLTPGDGETIVDDIIRGRVSFENRYIDDFIIIRSDGLPTYNFTSTVDDHKMEITHVIRAEEHLSNTPRQLLIAGRLGYDTPLYAHVPMILAPDHSKLSKRHGATAVSEYREMGILPEALVNYLALLGWSPGDDREIVDIEEMTRLFSLERVSKNPAIYDLKKLTWINGHYLRELHIDKVTAYAVPFLAKSGLISAEPGADEEKRLQTVIDLVRDRVKNLCEVADACNYFFIDDFPYDEQGIKEHFQKEGAGEVLKEIAAALEEVEPFEVENIKSALKQLSKKMGLKMAQVNLPLRLAVTGRTMGPDLFEIIALLGKEKVTERLYRACERFCS